MTRPDLPAWAYALACRAMAWWWAVPYENRVLAVSEEVGFLRFVVSTTRSMASVSGVIA